MSFDGDEVSTAVAGNLYMWQVMVREKRLLVSCSCSTEKTFYSTGPKVLDSKQGIVEMFFLYITAYLCLPYKRTCKKAANK